VRIHPRTLIGTGLLVAAASGMISVLRGQPLMTGQWGQVLIPGLGEIVIGTPLVFDIGVYLAVIGVTLIIILTLGEE
jgi:multicomponent Na+:H+ antiporter subunit B